MIIKGGYHIIDLTKISFEDAEDDTIDITDSEVLNSLKNIASVILNHGKLKPVLLRIKKDSAVDGILYGTISTDGELAFTISFPYEEYKFRLYCEYSLVENEDESIELRVSATIRGVSNSSELINDIQTIVNEAELSLLPYIAIIPTINGDLTVTEDSATVTINLPKEDATASLSLITLMNSTMLFQLAYSSLSADSWLLISRDLIALPYNDLGGTRSVRCKIEAQLDSNEDVVIKVTFDNDYRDAYSITGTVKAYFGKLYVQAKAN